MWLERDGALLRLRLARPKANLIDAAMVAALAGAFAAHRGKPKVLAALLDHEGPHFSFGASVEEHLPEHCERMLKGLHGLIEAMLDWPRPILVSVNGQCLGGGLELALHDAGVEADAVAGVAGVVAAEGHGHERDERLRRQRVVGQQVGTQRRRAQRQHDVVHGRVERPADGLDALERVRLRHEPPRAREPDVQHRGG